MDSSFLFLDFINSEKLFNKLKYSSLSRVTNWSTIYQKLKIKIDNLEVSLIKYKVIFSFLFIIVYS
jgi:hypothetical protein